MIYLYKQQHSFFALWLHAHTQLVSHLLQGTRRINLVVTHCSLQLGSLEVEDRNHKKSTVGKVEL